MNGTIKKLASPKQLKWLKDLLNDKDYSTFPPDWQKACDRLRVMFDKCIEEGYEAMSLNTWIVANNGKPLTHNDFQNLLEPLLKADKKTTAVHDTKVAKLEDGYYLKDGVYYRVVHNRKGTAQYAHRMKFLMTPEEAKALAGSGVQGKKVFTWKYAAGAIFKLKPEMLITNEQVTAQFGGLYSACCECGRLLNDPLSVHLNIGPVCGGRMFGAEFKGMLKEAKAAVDAKVAVTLALGSDPTDTPEYMADGNRVL